MNLHQKSADYDFTAKWGQSVWWQVSHVEHLTIESDLHYVPPTSFMVFEPRAALMNDPLMRSMTSSTTFRSISSLIGSELAGVLQREAGSWVNICIAARTAHRTHLKNDW